MVPPRHLTTPPTPPAGSCTPSPGSWSPHQRTTPPAAHHLLSLGARTNARPILQRSRCSPPVPSSPAARSSRGRAPLLRPRARCPPLPGARAGAPCCDHLPAAVRRATPPNHDAEALERLTGSGGEALRSRSSPRPIKPRPGGHRLAGRRSPDLLPADLGGRARGYTTPAGRGHGYSLLPVAGRGHGHGFEYCLAGAGLNMPYPRIMRPLPSIVENRSRCPLKNGMQLNHFSDINMKHMQYIHGYIFR